MGIAREKKKKTLKAKMLGILTMCAMTSLLAAVIVSYMELRMIQNDSIEDNMKMYLDQITKNTDEYSCAMKSHFRKFGNQMSGSGNHLCNYASLLA